MCNDILHNMKGSQILQKREGGEGRGGEGRGGEGRRRVKLCGEELGRGEWDGKEGWGGGGGGRRHMVLGVNLGKGSTEGSRQGEWRAPSVARGWRVGADCTTGYPPRQFLWSGSTHL